MLDTEVEFFSRDDKIHQSRRTSYTTVSRSGAPLLEKVVTPSCTAASLRNGLHARREMLSRP